MRKRQRSKLRAARTKPSDIEGFKLRKQDAIEIFRQTLRDPKEAVRDAVQSKIAETWTIFDDEDNVLCFFGVCVVSQLSESATIFALTSEYADKHKLDFALRSREMIRGRDKDKLGGLIKKYKYLFNNVDAEYTQCHKWLEFCGFTIDYDNPVMINGYKFYPFKGVYDV